MAERLITRDRSVIVAADVEPEKLTELVKYTCVVEGVGGYKLGFEIGLNGLPDWVNKIREQTSLPIIYDHQKAGTDIPQTADNFARVCKRSGVDAAILFPLAGPETQGSFTKALQDRGVQVLIGLHMTHPKFLASEGGYIADDAPVRAFELATDMGVKDFVVPGNKPEYVAKYRELLEIILGPDNFTLYSPGFLTQGGELSEMAKVAGNRWHAIVGSSIYKADVIMGAAEKITSQIR